MRVNPQHFSKNCLSGCHRDRPCSLVRLPSPPCPLRPRLRGLWQTSDPSSLSPTLQWDVQYPSLHQSCEAWICPFQSSGAATHVPPTQVVKQVKPGLGDSRATQKSKKHTCKRQSSLWAPNSFPGPGGMLSGCTNYPLSLLIISPFGFT